MINLVDKVEEPGVDASKGYPQALEHYLYEGLQYFGKSLSERQKIIPHEYRGDLERRLQDDNATYIIKNMRQALLSMDQIRCRLDRPLIINSFYRPEWHPVEKGKKTLGYHTVGSAVDFRPILKPDENMLNFVVDLHSTVTRAGGAGEIAQVMGFGVSQYFVHLDFYMEEVPPPEAQKDRKLPYRTQKPYTFWTYGSHERMS